MSKFRTQNVQMFFIPYKEKMTIFLRKLIVKAKDLTGEAYNRE